MSESKRRTIGWIGTGRMGHPMAARLLKSGCDVSVYNRTRSKAEPLIPAGGKLVATPSDLADRDLVFVMVAKSEHLKAVTLGPDGVLTRKGVAPKLLVDCSTVSEQASAEVRETAARMGTNMLAAPVSGNGPVVRAGRLSFVCSGPRAAFDEARPYLEMIGPGVTYVGDGEISRTVKICHNVFLAVIAQSLAEVTILAQKHGVPRHAFLDFINKSVLGSTFTRYKSPAYVNLDWTPLFTSSLLRKDLDLGLEAARAREVPLPVAALTREILQSLIGRGFSEKDFAGLLELEAQGANLAIVPENVKVSDGLES